MTEVLPVYDRKISAYRRKLLARTILRYAKGGSISAAVALPLTVPVLNGITIAQELQSASNKTPTDYAVQSVLENYTGIDFEPRCDLPSGGPLGSVQSLSAIITHRFDMQSVLTHLEPSVCQALLSKDPGAELNVGFTRSLVVAVHEANHHAGYASESVATCNALQQVPQMLIERGWQPKDVVNQYDSVLALVNDKNLGSYRSADCVENGKLDFTPNIVAPGWLPHDIDKTTLSYK